MARTCHAPASHLNLVCTVRLAWICQQFFDDAVAFGEQHVLHLHCLDHAHLLQVVGCDSVVGGMAPSATAWKGLENCVVEERARKQSVIEAECN